MEGQAAEDVPFLIDKATSPHSHLLLCYLFVPRSSHNWMYIITIFYMNRSPKPDNPTFIPNPDVTIRALYLSCVTPLLSIPSYETRYIRHAKHHQFSQL